MTKKYEFLPGDRDLCYRLKNGKRSGKILVARTTGPRTTSYTSTGTHDVAVARDQAAKLKNRTELLTKKGSEVTYDAGWLAVKEDRENVITGFEQKEYRWSMMQPALGHLRPARLRVQEQGKDGAFFKKYFEDVQHGRNKARVLPDGSQAGPLAPSSLKLYKDIICQIHTLWDARGTIGKDQVPYCDNRPTGVATLEHLPLPPHFSQDELDKLIRDGQHRTAHPPQTERLKGRPDRGLLVTLIGVSGPRRDRMENGLWQIVDWERREMHYPAVGSKDGRTPDAKALTPKRAPVAQISSQLFPVLRAAWQYDLDRCDGDVEKAKRLPILGSTTGIDRMFGKMCKRALGRHGKVHMLKHTGITLALSNGTDPLEVSTMFATSLPTILKHYWHAIPKNRQKVYDAIFGAKRATGNVVPLPVKKRDRN